MNVLHTYVNLQLYISISVLHVQYVRRVLCVGIKRKLGIFYACARHENVSDALNNFADEMKLSYSIRRPASLQILVMCSLCAY